MPGPSIQYLHRSQIDIVKWDKCIEEAPNGLIYAFSFYLDHMSKHWHALVLGDYEAVFPLTWNKKWGIYYLYQPAFTASLGIFGKNCTPELVKQFIAAIPSRFRLIEIDLNKGNATADGSLMRNNYILDLGRSYDVLYSNYRDNIRRNIKKCQQLNCRYETGIPVEEVLALSRQQLQKVSDLTQQDYTNFFDLYRFLVEKGKALTCGVYTASNELVASCVYFFSHKRAYYILVGNHPNGKTIGASHYLVDRFIHDHSEKELLLDFEGSDIRNLAFFYGSFGATTETYPALRINKLPWWLKWLKK
jgi:Acetyltransferase (GNAT) domain